MVGTKLGPYEITEQIGVGGMATVYRAYQPSMDRHVAVKVIRASMLGDAVGLDRFQREAQLVAKLEHPHLLPIYDFNGSHDPPYIVMRFLEGGTLKQVMQADPIPVDEMLYMLRQVSAALDYAHRQGVVHRDLKPSNIMIDREGNAFVADFGIARVSDAPKDLTGTGMVIGTPGYMAPEQARGVQGVDSRADVYSLGVIIFEMLTGRPPYERASPLEEVMAHLQEPVPDIRQIKPELPAAMQQVMQQSLAKEPADRYRTTGELLAALTDALQTRASNTPSQLRSLTQSFAADQLAALDQAAAEVKTPSDVQRQMTVLFMDVSDYAELLYGEEETEDVRLEIDRLWDVFERIVQDHGGSLESRTGESGMLLWGREETRESDPEQAVRAALIMKQALEKRAFGRLGESEEEPLPFKAAVTTGPVLLTREAAGGTSVSGTTVTLAGRLKESAPPGEILVSHDTYTNVRGVFDVRSLPPVRMRGRKEPIEVYVALKTRPRAFRLQARGIEGVETKMIGREPQLKILQDALTLTIEDGETQVVTVVGEAGVGKSRLLYEFSNWVDVMDETLWFFEARATQPSILQPYSLTRDLFSFRFEILDNDPLQVVHEKFETGIAGFMDGRGEQVAPYIGQLVGFDFSERAEVKSKLEEPEAFHREALGYLGEFFLTATNTHPVFIQVEDIHWADERSLDLLNSLARENTEIPLFLIYMARPELYERRPSWGEGQGFHARINLEPLSRLDSRRLVRELLKRVDEVPSELRDLIINRAEGNPFYMEELVKALIDDGVIVKGEDRWHVEMSMLAAARVPPTLVGVLQSRLDSLPPGERTLLQRASVVGRIFWESAAVHLGSAEAVTAGATSGMLEDLRGREMVFKREYTAFEGTAEFGFRHAILRDVIYETIVPSQRRAYHKLVAEWLIEAGRGRLDEYNLLIAEHFERAEEPALAATYLGRAARTASVVGTIDEAIGVARKALGLLEGSPHHEERMELNMQLGESLAIKGAYDEAIGCFEPALEAARALGDRLVEAKALAELGRVTGVWQDKREQGREYFDQALEIARELDDRKALAFITRQLGNMANGSGEVEKARAHLEESIQLAREVQDPVAESSAINSLGLTATLEGKHEEALALYREGLLIAERIRDRGLVAMLTGNLADVHRLQGSLAEAMRQAKKALALSQEVGSEYLISGHNWTIGGVELTRGNIETARQHLDTSLRLTKRMGSRTGMAFLLTEYARMRAGDGDRQGALEWLGLSRTFPSVVEGLGRIYFFKALKEVRGELSEEEAEACLARGAELDLESIIEDLLGET